MKINKEAPLLIRLLLVFSYIMYCIRLRVGPWKYFQLNANYFNEDRHIFSKLDMDLLIPKVWRLKQVVDQPDIQPEVYPVFVKPEWGQNSQGVCRVDNLQQLNDLRRQYHKKGPRYLLQEAAKGKCEFEVFYIPGAQANHSSAIISVTETCNSSDDFFPINGIYNQDSHYQSCMGILNVTQQQQIESLLSQIGEFKIARFCARADSLIALIEGKFSIVEINVYVPMPLLLLAQNVAFKDKAHFIFSTMKQLALVSQEIPASQPIKSIFFKKLQLSRLLKLRAKDGVIK